MWELDVARILREVLAAGSARDWDKMIALAKELEELARKVAVMEVQTQIQDNVNGELPEASFFPGCAGGLPVPHRASNQVSLLTDCEYTEARCFPTAWRGLGQQGNFPCALPGTPFTHPRGRTVAWSARSALGGMDIIRCIQDNNLEGRR